MNPRLSAVTHLTHTTVRWRTTLAATGVVAVVLAAAGFGLIALQHSQMESALRDLAGQQALDVSAQLQKQGIDHTDLSGSGSTERVLIQVIDRETGDVLTSSSSITGELAVIDARPPPGAEVSEVSSSLPISDGAPYVLIARGVSTGGTPLVVVAALSLEPASQAREVTSRIVMIGYLPLLVVVAAISYWLTGRALAPVHRIRRRVEDIGGDQLDQRVPVSPAHDEISALARTMNEMLDRLQDSATRRRQFVADASHELRSPVASIRAAHDVAQAHPTAMSTDELHTVVGDELDRLQVLVDDLLMLASTDARGLAPTMTSIRIDVVLRRAVDHRQGANPQVTLDLEPISITGDEHLLSRAVRNLTDNAARHAKSNVTVSLHHEQDEAVIRVLDDGPGIAAQDHDRIFDRFIRLDASRSRDAGGSGLGLSIAREIAVAHGGSLAAVASPHGAIFELRLPCSPSRPIKL